MKKTIISLILIVSFITGFSQVIDNNPWCPEGATWVYENRDNMWRSYTIYRYKKDTVVSGINSKQLELQGVRYYAGPETRITTPNRSYKYVYNSNDSVYGFYAGSFNFMYSFVATIGDSFVTKPNTDVQYCNTPYFGNNQILKVSSIYNDTVNHNWVEKIMFFDTPNTLRWSYGGVYKNIGAKNSFFPQPVLSDSCSVYTGEYQLVCYSDNLRGAITIAKGESSWLCHDIETSIVEPDKINQNWVSVYPNPASSKLYLQSIAQQQFTYRLFDALGKEVSNGIIGTNSPVNIDQLSSGFYFITLFHLNEKVSIKFIKQ